MEKFNYRAPRYLVDLPVRLTLENDTISGLCHEISVEGMCLELGRPLATDYAGTARIIHGLGELEIPVKFAHASSGRSGVKFAFASDQQRRDVAELVALLKAGMAQPSIASRL